ncbi:MBL fold metallo-hydrolase RNA specificity domain-containing protein [Aneurinibacillus uraniidurans]|uniref:MBL fold metallo-hydrolase RNA specificity domain-containing protein n=1 Tax=Aneurinibacillus uraniidurans TaxID=2966586 RepID=UPI00234A7DFD|nr:MBL fold metallo-hydrolase [Aneurinibacillus sp. B1]WCN37225.1 MBL fold metallo-hydrolase [Aneurinibacillus sp. B1]
MNIQCLGGAGTVTGSCYLLTAGESRILIDCGMFQGSGEIEERNREPFAFAIDEIDAVVLTHAHIDHSGLIPKLCRDGFRGQVICTHSTAELCSILLPDSGHIQEVEAERRNRKKKGAKTARRIGPLYTEEDGRRALSRFLGIGYDEMYEVVPGVQVRLQDAGHVLGSAIIELWVEIEEGKTCKVVFSGDLGSRGQAIVKDPAWIAEADYVFIESTYGDRLHDHTTDRRQKLGSIVQRVQEEGGTIIIPSFSVGRTQEIIYELTELLEHGTIKPMPVFIDSPLAIEATRVFRHHEDVFDEESQEYIRRGMDPLALPGLVFVETREESQRLNRVTSGAMIISSSGMCEAGRIKHHLRHHIWRPKSHVVFVGYQAPGTLGRRIVDGARHVRIFGRDYKVAAHVHMIEGFSAHADRDGLLSWLSGFTKKPKKVIVVHGEPDVRKKFAQTIQEELDLDTVIPERFDTIELVMS